MAEPFKYRRDAALALLNCGKRLTPQAGSFLGKVVVDPSPLSEKQADWLDNLLERAGLPPYVGGAE
jgi:hypothetical protein